MFTLQQNFSQLQEKIANAPDNLYVTGIVIGVLLPLCALVALLYLLYSYIKNKKTIIKNASTRNNA